MEVSDQIAVLHRGRLEQVGSPQELYDEPASEFVMRFVGDASAIGGALVRPHDIELREEPVPGGVETQIERLTILGGNVKLELRDTAGEPVLVVLSRERLSELELEQGQIVWAQPTRQRVFAPAAATATA